MEIAVKLAWLCVLLVHVMPSLILIAPGLSQSLYGVSPDGELAILVVHRGALFLAIVASATFAIVDRRSRRLASVVSAIGVVGFLIVYARAGMLPGALRTIALIDVLLLLPLAFVSWEAWRAKSVPEALAR